MIKVYVAMILSSHFGLCQPSWILSQNPRWPTEFKMAAQILPYADTGEFSAWGTNPEKNEVK